MPHRGTRRKQAARFTPAAASVWRAISPVLREISIADWVTDVVENSTRARSSTGTTRTAGS
jgi:hypothetical protein